MEEFNSKLKKADIIDILNKYMKEFDPNEYVIVYKAGLVLRGLISECNDIDIEISKSIAKELNKKLIPFNVAPSGDYRYQLGERIEAFYSGGERHVQKTEFVHGFQCTELEECIDTYRKRNRPKDIITLKMVEDALKH